MFPLSKAPLIPSLERNKRVDPMRSNWIAAVPNTSGDAKVRRAWLREKVRRRERSWSRTSERAERSEVERREGAAGKEKRMGEESR